MRHDTHHQPTTAEDYLRWEEGNSAKHEYVGGHVYAMAGVTKRHNVITLNLAFALRARARQRGCEVFATDVKLQAAPDRYYYPDIMVACGRATDFEQILTQPSLVVEVTSKATRRSDNQEKLDAYTRLPSLRAYLIVDQRRRHVLLVSRSASGDWTRSEITAGDFELDFLGCTVSMDAIYDGVELPPMSVGEEDEYESWDEEDDED